MKISVIGLGYVGLSLALLLSNKNKVVAHDINRQKISELKNGNSPIQDQSIIDLVKDKSSNLIITNDFEEVTRESDFIIIATPTDYDADTNAFDTSSVEDSIKKIIINSSNKPSIVIKSTVPLGFTEKMKSKFNYKKIFFSPEFLREGSSIEDNLYPSRIIVGDNSSFAKTFAKLLFEISKKQSDKIKILHMSSSEAEGVKLFANTYLAMRISFFNELDSFCENKNLGTEKVIEGVCLDNRIGNFYNNPSFGYGGYCLPKDTQQLLRNYDNVPNSIITAIVDANSTRKDYIASAIIDMQPKVVGIYRLVMKEGSDNFRQSAVQGIINRLKSKGITIMIYEPILVEETYLDSKVINNINLFKEKSDLIVANRMSLDLKDVIHKVYTRDIFGNN